VKAAEALVVTSSALAVAGASPLDLSALQALASSVGFPDATIAAAVAMAESHGDPAAAGDVDKATGKATSFGLWQIHVPAHKEYDPASLLDATYNARAALAISLGGKDWSPWSTFNDGSYLAFMPGGSPPAKRASAQLSPLVILAGLYLWSRRKRFRR
jgi:hypothetical protein